MNMNKEVRLKSLDALRGFDMLFIMGFAGWIVALCNLLPSGCVTEWLTAQMSHVKWIGLAHHDTIFPLFLFVAGISFPFSLAKQRANGKSGKSITLKVIKRGLVLVLLGFIYNGILRLNFPDVRFASVLARIGLAWMFAALIFMHFKPKTCWIISAIILIGYWLIMWLIPGGEEPFSFENNLVGTIDRALLPGRLNDKTFDPEGILSTLPSIVTALLGMFTGQLVQLPDERLSGNRKVLYLLLAAAVCIAAGLIWSNWFPINKKLWTSTFVLVVAGYSLIMFALFYYIIDVKGYYKWSFFFQVIGLNSITIYLAQRIINFRQIADFFLGGIATKCPEDIGKLIAATGYVAACWLFLYVLYKKKIFLKV
ncbi:MAG: DUF5009 domain-containing protein [Tannerella sp.]|jgi:predicted acyltransferase|nr:DUF5009 domain-containing protein [Tannerella sp.]